MFVCLYQIIKNKEGDMHFSTVIFIFFFSSIILFSSVFAEAGTCVKYGSSGQKIYYACPDDEDRQYPAKWKVQTTREGNKVVKKEIDINSVCYNYPVGSIEYRRCRRQAKAYFKERCRELQQRYRTTKRPYNEEFEIDMKSFCYAERAM